MDIFFRGLNDESAPCPRDILRCPFFRNINEPNDFSFSSLHLPMSVRSGKGPIFEDGPNFDMAFRLFHGSDGVVLSERSYPNFEKEETRPVSLKFNPLAAKGGQSNHEVTSNEWLQNGNCPIAKSYRAVSGVLPIVAKAFQPPPGVKLRCPPAIVAARAAIARTFAKNLRPQSLPTKVVVIGMLGMSANVPLWVWREHTEKFSVSWFVAVHATVPFIGMLRKSVLIPKSAMAFTMAESVLGQVIGCKAERYRVKAQKMELVGIADGNSSKLRGVSVKGRHCGESVGVGGTCSSAEVLC